MKHLIKFLSDFGTVDGYVEAVKGAIKRIDPKCEIIDVTNDIPSFDIRRARWALAGYFNQSPPGTVHLCVVDPGVGSARRGLIVEAGGYYFVGPDNGLFKDLLSLDSACVYSIELKNKPRSATFHGRDIFGPVAARLAAGKRPGELGSKLDNVSCEQSRLPSVIGIASIPPLLSDHFGNIIFDLKRNQMPSNPMLELQFKEFKANHISEFYQQVAAGAPLFLWNSRDYLELAINQGNAANYFALDFQQDNLTIRVTGK